MYKVYGDELSGNCYKIKLLLHLLNINYEWLHVDILAGETRTPEFMQINRNSQIPVLEISHTEYLCESNAILNYLAEGTPFLPDAGLPRAKVLQWQFYEQYSHEPYIAVARYINKYLGLPPERIHEYRAKQKGGYEALAVMEEQLNKSDFLIGDVPSIADISLYAYTHVCHEGGFSLGEYAGIRKWLQRIEGLPNYVSMQKSQAPA